nr:helix-turn-helix domain-containing protein [Corynebacterium pygosceleis]
MQVGARLRWVADGTDRLTWGDLVSIVECARYGTATYKHLAGDYGEWSDTEYLLADVIDSVSLISWQLSAKEGSPPPKPYPRPGQQQGTDHDDLRSTDCGGEQDGDPFNADESGVFRGEAVSLDELNEWLGWAPTQQDRVRDEYAAGGVTYKELAAKYGVSASTIGRWIRAA